MAKKDKKEKTRKSNGSAKAKKARKIVNKARGLTYAVAKVIPAYDVYKAMKAANTGGLVETIGLQLGIDNITHEFNQDLLVDQWQLVGKVAIIDIPVELLGGYKFVSKQVKKFI